MFSNVDVIFISCGDYGLHEITQNAIDSLRSSEEFAFNIFVVESNLSVTYSDCVVIRPVGEFNYNKYVNQAFKYCEGDYVAICNNDLIFHKGWMSSNISAFSLHPEIFSISPKCPFWRNGEYLKHNKFKSGIYKGFSVGEELTGWCFVVKRIDFNIIIKKLDESVEFWYSDNIYANQLNSNGLIHALNANSLVTHLFGKSHVIINDKINYYTIDQKEKFVKKLCKFI